MSSGATNNDGSRVVLCSGQVSDVRMVWGFELKFVLLSRRVFVHIITTCTSSVYWHLLAFTGMI